VLAYIPLVVVWVVFVFNLVAVAARRSWPVDVPPGIEHRRVPSRHAATHYREQRPARLA
jgi:hypothetical protein